MIHLKNVDFFKRSVDAISTFISEGNFHFSSKGIFLKALDPSQILLVDYFADKSIFSSYDIEPCVVGVDLVEFNKILQRTLPNDELFLSVSDSELIITFRGELNRNFRLPLLDITDSEVSAPSSSFDCTISINGRLLKESLRDAALFGSSVFFKAKDSDLFIEAKGPQGTLESSINESKLVSVSCENEVVCKYSLNFLQNIVKESSLDLPVSLSLKNDSALKVSYSIGDSKITFYLAHMIL